MSSASPAPDDATPKEEPVVQGAGFDFSDPNSPLAPYYLRTSHVLAILLIALVFLFFSLFVPLWHSDFWGHLKFGEWMLDQRQLPEREPFSPFADREHPYANLQWISQGFYALWFRLGVWMSGSAKPLEQLAGGVEMVRAWHGLLVALRCVLLLGAFRRQSGSLPLACLGLLTVLWFSLAPSAIQRPQALGEVCFAALLFLVSGPELGWRGVALIPLVLVFWANAHGSFLMGLALLGSMTAGRFIETWTTNSWTGLGGDRQLRRLALASALSILAVAFLNPHGPALFELVFELAGNPNVATMDEWRPLNFSQSTGGHWGFLMMLLLLLASQLASPRPLTPGQLLLVGLFGLAPLFQERLMTWWFMILPWVLVPLWKSAAESFREWMQQKTPENPAGSGSAPSGLGGWWESVPSFRKTLAAAMLILIAVVWSSPFQWLLGQLPLRVDRHNISVGTPLELSWELNPTWKAEGWPVLKKALGGKPFQGGIFATEILSDYLLWSVPQAPLFVYSHVHLFPKQHWDEYQTVLKARTGWQEVLDRHRINLVAIEPDIHTELAEALRKSKQWQVFLDESQSPAKPNRLTRLLMAVRAPAKGVAP